MDGDTTMPPVACTCTCEACAEKKDCSQCAHEDGSACTCVGCAHMDKPAEETMPAPEPPMAM
ncbi:MAG: hypothetical protein ACMG57_03385 [Candidatus Dojkabacteria bacterium]